MISLASSEQHVIGVSDSLNKMCHLMMPIDDISLLWKYQFYVKVMHKAIEELCLCIISNPRTVECLV